MENNYFLKKSNFILFFLFAFLSVFNSYGQTFPTCGNNQNRPGDNFTTVEWMPQCHNGTNGEIRITGITDTGNSSPGYTGNRPYRVRLSSGPVLTGTPIYYDIPGNNTSFNVTASASASPFSFTYTPGAGDAGNTVTITVTTNNPSGAPCTAATATYSLSVSPSPTASITGPTSVCMGSTVTLTGNYTNTTGATWSIVSGGGSLSSTTCTTTGCTTIYTPAATGTAVIQLQTVASGSCPAATATQNININTIPIVGPIHRN